MMIEPNDEEADKLDLKSDWKDELEEAVDLEKCHANLTLFEEPQLSLRSDEIEEL